MNYGGVLGWETLVGFVLRVAMIDDGRYPFKIFNESSNNPIRMLGIIWIWACFVLLYAYSGNLTAMLTRSILTKPINSIEDLLNQTDFKWSLVDDGHDLVEYLKVSESLRPLFDLAGKDVEPDFSSYCWYNKEERDSGTHVTICDYQSIRLEKSIDYSETGKCNFYNIDETFFVTPQVMAFQVGQNVGC